MPNEVSTPKYISNYDLIMNCYKAYKEGRLGVQNSMEECFYDYSLEGGPAGVVCAVGASYIPSCLADNGTGIREVVDHTPGIQFEDLDLAEKLQCLHDGACSHVSYIDRERLRKDFESFLLAKVEELNPMVP